MDVVPISATVEMEDGLRVPVKLLDCDTISQAKEKLLDSMHKAAPVSRRPKLTEVDLGMCVPTVVPRQLMIDASAAQALECHLLFAQGGQRGVIMHHLILLSRTPEVSVRDNDSS